MTTPKQPAVSKGRSGKKVRARKIQIHSYTGISPGEFAHWITGPVFVLPDTPEAYAAMVRQGALAIGRLAYKEAKATDLDDPACYTRKPEAKDIEFYSKYAAAVLASYGIHPPAAVTKNKGKE